MQQLSITAICPKCQAPTLRRSHSLTPLEKYRKQRTQKRIYRCHNCQWRGWLYENELRFPPIATTIDTSTTEVEDVILIPEVKLDDINIEALPPVVHAEVSVPDPVAPTSPAAIVQPVQEHAGQPWQASGMMPQEPGFTSPPARDSFTPDFGETRPISHPVPNNYHSHHRHSGRSCPACKSDALYRSHAKGFFEKLGKLFRHNKRIYRCHECNWRGWLPRQ